MIRSGSRWTSQRVEYATPALIPSRRRLLERPPVRYSLSKNDEVSRANACVAIKARYRATLAKLVTFFHQVRAEPFAARLHLDCELLANSDFASSHMRSELQKILSDIACRHLDWEFAQLSISRHARRRLHPHRMHPLQSLLQVQQCFFHVFVLGGLFRQRHHGR